MDATNVIMIAKLSIGLLLKVSLPFLLVSLLVGVIISLFQALTQIQEPTLSFVPKIISVFFTILLTFSFVGNQFASFMQEIFSQIVYLY